MSRIFATPTFDSPRTRVLASCLFLAVPWPAPAADGCGCAGATSSPPPAVSARPASPPVVAARTQATASRWAVSDLPPVGDLRPWRPRQVSAAGTFQATIREGGRRPRQETGTWVADGASTVVRPDGASSRLPVSAISRHLRSLAEGAQTLVGVHPEISGALVALLVPEFHEPDSSEGEAWRVLLPDPCDALPGVFLLHHRQWHGETWRDIRVAFVADRRADR